MQDHGIDTLISELRVRLEKDYRRMKKWRNFHRMTGLLLTSVMLFVPAVLASGFIKADSDPGKVFVLLITLASGFNAAFQPLLLSYRRRIDMNTSRRLSDDFNTDILQSDEVKKIRIYKYYADNFAQMYAQRGEGLIESSMLKQDKNKPGDF